MAFITINNILDKDGLISKESGERATPYLRFEKDSPNEMWRLISKEIMPWKTMCAVIH